MDYKKIYQKELNDNRFDDNYKKKLRELSEEEIEESFYTTLKFGTAGIRGKVGVGTNRLHKYNIIKVSYSFAQYLNKISKNPTAVIAFDSRIDSPFFAKQTAITLASYGVKTYLFDNYSATPELSFAIRYLKCTGGVVITASHNPPEYSGYKTYHSSGRQISDDEAKMVTEIYNSVEDVFDIELKDFNELLKNEKIVMVGDEIFNAFSNDIVKNVDVKEEVDLNVVYTPLHGVGYRPMKQVLESLKVKNVNYVEEQKNPDGNFPTEKTPNPEDPSVYKYALDLASKVDADIIVASDPDADRLGAMIKHNGEYIFVGGNQMGMLLLDYVIKTKGVKEKSFAISTIVSSKMISKIGEVEGFVVPRTLTGFKHICNAMNDYLDKGYNYLMGYEESFGYLIYEHIRDKDSISSAVGLVKLAEMAKKENKTLIDKLEDLYKKYGYFKEGQIVFKLEGIEGKKKIEKIISNLRNTVIDEINGKKLVKKIDFLTDETSLPKQNAIRWDFEDDTWFAIRPSGTEPKLKVYYGVHTDSAISTEKELLSLEKNIKFILEK